MPPFCRDGPQGGLRRVGCYTNGRLSRLFGGLKPTLLPQCLQKGKKVGWASAHLFVSVPLPAGIRLIAPCCSIPKAGCTIRRRRGGAAVACLGRIDEAGRKPLGWFPGRCGGGGGAGPAQQIARPAPSSLTTRQQAATIIVAPAPAFAHLPVERRRAARQHRLRRGGEAGQAKCGGDGGDARHAASVDATSYRRVKAPVSRGAGNARSTRRTLRRGSRCVSPRPRPGRRFRPAARRRATPATCRGWRGWRPRTADALVG